MTAYKSSSDPKSKNIEIHYPALIYNNRFFILEQNSPSQSMKWQLEISASALKFPDRTQPFNVFFIVEWYLMFHYCLN